jgi:predicted Zn-dependent protease
MATLSFSISTADFDASLLPLSARQPGTPAFREAVDAFLQSEFRDFGGQALIRVDDHNISVVWTPEPAQYNPVGFIVKRLEQGKQAEVIQLLEMLLRDRPDDFQVVFHLGLALVEAKRPERAIANLRKALRLKPSSVEAQTALAIALRDTGEYDEAARLLNSTLDKLQAT